MAKRYRPYAPDQSYLLPPSPREWLPQGHLVFFITEFVGQLDLGAIERRLQAVDPRGERPYSPQMMTALLLYGYTTGVYSSRRMERATVEDVAFRVVVGGEHPHFTTINAFRATHREALAALFIQVLEACQSAGLVKLGHVAIDGTKMKANASKHKAMSHDRLVKDSARLRDEVDSWLTRAEAEDAADEAIHGPYDPAAEVRMREEKLAKMKAALEALKQETAAARAKELRAQAEGLRHKAAQSTTPQRDQRAFTTLAKKRDQQAALFDDDDADPPAAGPDDDLPRNTPPHDRNGDPTPHAQRNFTDAESRIMVRDGAYLQGYNAQIAVDDTSQIIVAAAVSNQAPDAEYFAPMLRRIVQNCAAVPERVTGDTGYFSAANVAVAEHMGCEPFIAVGKLPEHGAPIDLASLRPHERTPAKLAMRAQLQTPNGRAVYARRKSTVEPVFGHIRACRGFRQFSFRGLFKSRCEWSFVCLAHNLLKLFRATGLRPALAAG